MWSKSSVKEKILPVFCVILTISPVDSTDTVSMSGYNVCQSRKSSGTVIATVGARSKINCAEQCGKTPGCIAANYVKRVGKGERNVCELLENGWLVDDCASYPQTFNSTVLSMKPENCQSGFTFNPTSRQCLKNVAACPPAGNPNAYQYNVTTDLCFWITSGRQTWDEARRTCEGDGGHLLRLKTEAEFLTVKQAIYDTPGYDDAYLVDGTEDDQGMWIFWGTSTTPWLRWGDGEPNSGSEKCICLQASNGCNMNNVQCARSYTCGFICQIDV